jgi:LysM repeat protein
MSDFTETDSELPEARRRCPHCDSVVEPGADHCLMCGKRLDGAAAVETAVSLPAPEPKPILEPEPEPEIIPDVVESVMQQREAPVTFWLTAVFAVIIVVLGALVLRFQGGGITVALAPSPTPIPSTPTWTLTWTPLATDVLAPTNVPVATAVPSATPTLQPPQPHTVSAGETLIGLALRFRVSVESIAELNSIPADSSLLVNQALQIPWPTPTPPLVPVATLINGETVIADPTDCERYQIQSGDSLSGVAARYDVDFNLFLLVNRLTAESIPQPGDVVCIPEIVYGGNLPPTPGPSPTPTVTAPPPGPQLLYPVANAVIQPPDGLVTLQWTAVKNLAEDEWYMVELTDLDHIDDLPYRGFTRDTAFHIPSSWRPKVEETHVLQWKVSIVVVNGRRADGLPIYTYGGQTSAPAFFSWEGAIPTPTPLPTATATPEE